MNWQNTLPGYYEATINGHDIAVHKQGRTWTAFVWAATMPAEYSGEYKKEGFATKKAAQQHCHSVQDRFKPNT